MFLTVHMKTFLIHYANLEDWNGIDNSTWIANLNNHKMQNIPYWMVLRNLFNQRFENALYSWNKYSKQIFFYSIIHLFMQRKGESCVDHYYVLTYPPLAVKPRHLNARNRETAR